MQGGRLATARIGILTILDEEFAAVALAFGTTRQFPLSPYYTTEDDSNTVILRQTPDRANVAASQAASKMIEDFRPELIAVVGIGGGIAGRDGIETGDVALASYLHYAEFRKLVPKGELKRYFAYDQPSVTIRESHADPCRRKDTWVDAISEARPTPGRPKVVVGSVVAGERILSAPGHDWQKQVVDDFNDAVAIDMESVGVARAIHEARAAVDYNPRFMVVRGVSDLVRSEETKADSDGSPDNTAERALWKRYAAAGAASFAHSVVEDLLTSVDLRDRSGIPK